VTTRQLVDTELLLLIDATPVGAISNDNLVIARAAIEAPSRSNVDRVPSTPVSFSGKSGGCNLMLRVGPSTDFVYAWTGLQQAFCRYDSQLNWRTGSLERRAARLHV